MKTPFIGGSYVARSLNAVDNNLINMYVEVTPDGKDPAALFRCPGYDVKTTFTGQTGSECRGAYWFYDRFYAVVGNTFFSVNASTYAATSIGTVSGSGPVSMVDNGTQLFIACNPDGYIYNRTTLAFGQITDPDFLGAVTVGFLNQYFIYTVPNSQKFQWTAILDGTSIDPLDFASAEGSPDDVVALIIDHKEVWLFGTTSTEVWQNTGTLDDPFQAIPGAFIEQGCAAPYSVAKADNSIFWLATDPRGEGLVVRANGYIPQRVSTYALDTAIEAMTTISDAIGFTYQQGGHTFYFLTFPTEQQTWVLDVHNGLWHQRAWLNPSTGILERHRANCYAFNNGTHLIGDHGGGLTNTSYFYRWSFDIYADGDYPQKWLRSWRALPTGQNNLKRSMQHSIQIDGQTGTGLATGQGSDPQVLLRWSDDGGHRWSNYHTRSMGAIGATGTRVIFRRLGSTDKLRDRVYELSGTDPVIAAWTAAELELTGAAS